MHREIMALYKRDEDLPERSRTMTIRHAVLDGSFYDVLQYDYYRERDDNGQYIPVRQRAPSVSHGLCRTVVNDSVSLLFSEGRFPEVYCEGEATREGLAKLIKDCGLNTVMIEAAHFGSAGSVAMILEVVASRLFIRSMRTTYLTPEFLADAPDQVERMVEKYKTKGRALRALGYDIADGDLGSDFWFEREWDATGEIWFVPRKVLKTEADRRIVDEQRTVRHSLGFCPVLWVKNLPGGDAIDGTSTFDPIGIKNQVEMDYQLSAGGRGLRYTSSPTLVLKTDDPKQAKQEHVVGDALVVPTTGDAHHLEINGQAIASVIEYCEYLRKMTLEALGGARSDPDKLSAAQSGRAMEMLNQSLIWLADKLKASYGEKALRDLLRMAIRINARMPLVDADGEKIGVLDPKEKITLKWSPWYPPTYADQSTQATAVTTLREKGVMSKRTAVTVIAPTYDIEDVDAELKEIEGDADAVADRDVRKEVETAKGTRPFEYNKGSK